MVKGTITQATAQTTHILRTTLYEVGLRKVGREHVKHKVPGYFSVVPRKMPGLNKMFR